MLLSFKILSVLHFATFRMCYLQYTYSKAVKLVSQMDLLITIDLFEAGYVM
jgi:hypothetical protein